MFAVTTDDLMENARRDATKTASSSNRSESHLGTVDCSLAVTNNSPVWRPQGTHGEALPLYHLVQLTVH